MLLAAAILALLSGPLLFELGRLGHRTSAFLEGFAFITIAGLFLFAILPEALEVGGTATWAFAVLGVAFPLAVERLFHAGAHRAHLAFLVLGMLGLIAHCILDGLVLLGAAPGGAGDHGLAEKQGLAIVLHNMPKGIALWFLLAPAFGRRVAAAVLVALVASTWIGYQLGGTVLDLLTGPGVAWFQAFVAGSILHVIVHGVTAHEHVRSGLVLPRWPERIGQLGGLLFLFAYL